MYNIDICLIILSSPFDLELVILGLAKLLMRCYVINTNLLDVNIFIFIFIFCLCYFITWKNNRKPFNKFILYRILIYISNKRTII
jgi:hypothetical protein